MKNPPKIDDHLAQPGPGYWDWRCLACSEPCADHISVVGWMLNRFALLLGDTP